jgi:hypothetical protein
MLQAVQRQAKSERQAIQDTDSIFAFMQQSHISKRTWLF